jgi:HNH endonuclease
MAVPKRHAVEQPLHENYRLIPLTQGQNAIVDLADYDWLSDVTWYAQYSPHTKTFYANRRELGIDGKIISMARIIVGLPRWTTSDDTREVDHINGNTLDNRRANLRISTPAENLRNKKRFRENQCGYKGVTAVRHKRANGEWHCSGWRVQVCIDGQQIRFGRFPTAEEAAREYDRIARLAYGPFAKTNF